MNKCSRFLAECIVALAESIFLIFFCLYLLFVWIVIAPICALKKTLEKQKKEDKHESTQKS